MSISEISKLTNLSNDTLRYYERIGLIPHVSRNKNGIRKYEEKDIEWIKFVKRLKNAGLSIEDIIEYVDLFMGGEDTKDVRKGILLQKRKEILNKISELNSTLEYLNMKINNYEDGMRDAENKMRGLESDEYGN